jgi:hypothetical protein
LRILKDCIGVMAEEAQSANIPPAGIGLYSVLVPEICLCHIERFAVFLGIGGGLNPNHQL